MMAIVEGSGIVSNVMSPPPAFVGVPISKQVSPTGQRAPLNTLMMFELTLADTKASRDDLVKSGDTQKDPFVPSGVTFPVAAKLAVGTKTAANMDVPMVGSSATVPSNFWPPAEPIPKSARLEGANVVGRVNVAVFDV